MEIEFVTSTFIKDVIDFYEDKGKYQPIGKYYAIDNKGYVACDNSEGKAITEFFNKREEAISWLKDKRIHVGVIAKDKITSQEAKVTRFDGFFVDVYYPDKKAHERLKVDLFNDLFIVANELTKENKTL